MKKSNVIFFILGTALLAYLVYRTGPAELWSRLGELNWLFFLGVGVFLFSKVTMSVAWIYLLEKKTNNSSLWHLSLVTAVGGALNDVTPGGVGGEPLKVTWLRGRIPSEDLVSSLILHNYLYIMTNVVLIFSGGALIIFLVDLPAWADWAIGSGMVLMVAGGILLAFVIRRGVAEKVMNVLKFLRIPLKNAEAIFEKARETDRKLRDFYRDRPGDFIKAFLWMLLTRAIAAMESFFILAMLGHIVGPEAIVLITCMGVALYVLFAFVPSQLGALEGGAFLFYPIIGLPAALGLHVEMIRRLRVLFLLFLAVLVLGIRSFMIRRVAEKGAGDVTAGSLELNVGGSSPPVVGVDEPDNAVRSSIP